VICTAPVSGTNLSASPAASVADDEIAVAIVVIDGTPTFVCVPSENTTPDDAVT